MGVRKGRGRLLGGLILAASFAISSVTPVFADTDLVVGDRAKVAYTNGDGVNFRDAVGYSANIINTLPEGATVSVIGGPLTDENGDLWYNVDVDGALGWIISDYLARPAATSGTTVTVVNTDGHGLRLRSAPTYNSSTLTVMPEGTSVNVVGEQKTDGDGNVWVNVSYDGQSGYASRDYLKLGGSTSTIQSVSNEEPESASLSVGGNAEVTGTNGDGLNLRYDASYSAGVATVVMEGEVVKVTDGPVEAGGVTWWGVDYKGTGGWMHGGYLTPTDKEPAQRRVQQASTSPRAEQRQAPAQVESGSPAASSVGEQIVATAMQYLGYPYVWGGVGPNGFDCSGFVYFVVNKVTGGGLSRAMEVQAVSGSYVAPENLQPGDIVFQQNTYKWGLSHAGIYIGDGKFINAANERVGVVISNLWDSYWGPRYYTARRIG